MREIRPAQFPQQKRAGAALCLSAHPLHTQNTRRPRRRIYERGKHGKTSERRIDTGVDASLGLQVALGRAVSEVHNRLQTAVKEPIEH